MYQFTFIDDENGGEEVELEISHSELVEEGFAYFEDMVRCGDYTISNAIEEITGAFYEEAEVNVLDLIIGEDNDYFADMLAGYEPVVKQAEQSAINYYRGKDE